MGCSLAATSVSLAAGANNPRIPASEVVGHALNEEDNKDEAKEAAFIRMLERDQPFGPGPFADRFKRVLVLWGGRGSRLGSSSGEATPNVPLGTRVFRPRKRTFFTSLIAR